MLQYYVVQYRESKLSIGTPPPRPAGGMRLGLVVYYNGKIDINLTELFVVCQMILYSQHLSHYVLLINPDSNSLPKHLTKNFATEE